MELPPPSWPALCRPSTPSGSAIDSPVRIALYLQSLRVGYNGVLVDGRVKPGHHDLSRPRINKTTAGAIRAKSPTLVALAVGRVSSKSEREPAAARGQPAPKGS